MANSIVDIVAIAARLTIAVLTTGAWRAVRQHARETQVVNAKHSTGKAARVSVVQSDHPALAEITRLHSLAYAEHRRMTMPTCQDGMRFLLPAYATQHATRMTEIGDAVRLQVDALARDGAYRGGAEYRRCMAKLNGLFVPAAWARDEQALRECYTYGVRYLACPTDGAWADWLVESTRAAELEMRQQLTDALERVRERCMADGGEGRLHETVFSSLAEIARLAPGFDFDGRYAPVFARLAPLATTTADAVRDDKHAREQAAQAAADILSVLGGVK